MMSDRNIPSGFRFSPTDEELIRGLLFPKTIGYPLPCNAPVLDTDVYAEAPWNVFADDSSPYWNNLEPDGTKKSIYVFTKLTKKTSKSKNNSRTAGCGTWSGQTGPKTIKNSTTGEIVGEMRMLSFHTSPKSKSDSDHRHNWSMHEYGLSGDALKAIGERNNDIVLCKITKNRNKVDILQQQPAQFSLPVEGNTVIGGGDRESTTPPNTLPPADDEFFEGVDDYLRSFAA